jgi:5-methyltetrahydropteroyltriglutamate--homocysteine methyltransferase
MGGFSALKHLPAGGPTVVLGLLSSKRPELDDDDHVLRRLDEAAAFAPLDQLALSTQCGFASTLPGNELTPADQWAKLEQVVRLAHRAWS